jgi:uncharacterized membrane protein YkoI
MDRTKLIVGAAVAVLTLGGGGAAIAAQQAQEEGIKGGTITAPQGSGEENEGAENEVAENEKAENEENESGGQNLQGFAKIDQAAAEEAALAAVPGEVREVELESEGGFVAYDVEVSDNGGNLREVIVDAGNGKVVAQGTEGGED